MKSTTIFSLAALLLLGATVTVHAGVVDLPPGNMPQVINLEIEPFQVDPYTITPEVFLTSMTWNSTGTWDGKAGWFGSQGQYVALGYGGDDVNDDPISLIYGSDTGAYGAMLIQGPMSTWNGSLPVPEGVVVNGWVVDPLNVHLYGAVGSGQVVAPEPSTLLMILPVFLLLRKTTKATLRRV